MTDLSRSASPILPAPITTEDYSFLIQSILPQPSSSSSYSTNEKNTNQSGRGSSAPSNHVSGRSLLATPALANQSELSMNPSNSQSACVPKKVRQKMPFREALFAPSDDDSGCAVDEVTWSANDFQPQILRTIMPGVQWNHLEREAMVAATMRQLPPQDFDENFCQSLSEAEKRELKLFNMKRKKENFGRGKVEIVMDGWIGEGSIQVTSRGQRTPGDENMSRRITCFKCGLGLTVGELSIKAEKVGLDLFWHPSCFVCSECQEILVDWIYFHDEGRLFCGRHHAEKLKPRCNACEEIIFADECTEAESKSWHVGHFICQSCHVQLGGRRYVIVGGTPFCCPCFDRLAPEGNICSACGLVINYDEGYVTCESNKWHSKESCFSCLQCNKSLLEQKFYLEDNKLFCYRCYHPPKQLIDSNNKIDSRDSPDTSIGKLDQNQKSSKQETSQLTTSVESETSLDEKLMNVSLVSSESDVYTRQLGGKSNLCKPTSTTNFEEDITKQFLTGVHSYKSCSSYINDNNKSTTNNNLFTSNNYLSSLSNVNLYERLHTGSDRSSLRLYETVISEAERPYCDFGRHWLNAVRSGNWMVSDGLGGDVERWMDRCRLEVNGRQNGDVEQQFTFKISNKNLILDKNSIPSNSNNFKHFNQICEKSTTIEIPKSNRDESKGNAQQSPSLKTNNTSHNATSGSNQLHSYQTKKRAKNPLQSSKARRWSRFKVDGYSSDTGNKRRKADDNKMVKDGTLNCIELKDSNQKVHHNRSKRLQAAFRYYQRHKSLLSSEDDDDDDEGGKLENWKIMESSSNTHNTYDKVFDDNGDDDDDDLKGHSISSSNDNDDGGDDKNGFYHELSPVTACNTSRSDEKSQQNIKIEKIESLGNSKLSIYGNIKSISNQFHSSGTNTNNPLQHIDYQNLNIEQKATKHSVTDKETFKSMITSSAPSPQFTRQPRLGVGGIRSPNPQRSLLADLSPFRYRKRLENNMNHPFDKLRYNIEMDGMVGEKMKESRKKLEVKELSGPHDKDDKGENYHHHHHHNHHHRRHSSHRHRCRHHRRLHQHWRDWYSTCGSSSSCTSDDCDMMTSYNFLFTSSSTSSSEFDYYLDDHSTANGQTNMATAASFSHVGHSAGSRMMTGNGSALTTCFSSMNRFKNRNKVLYVTSERWEKNKDRMFYPKQCTIS